VADQQAGREWQQATPSFRPGYDPEALRRRSELVGEIGALRRRAAELEAELHQIDEAERQRASAQRLAERNEAQQAREELTAATLRELQAAGASISMLASRLFVKKAIVEALLAGERPRIFRSVHARVAQLGEEVRAGEPVW
jgi:chromosome segregation ATPase